MADEVQKLVYRWQHNAEKGFFDMPEHIPSHWKWDITNIRQANTQEKLLSMLGHPSKVEQSCTVEDVSTYDRTGLITIIVKFHMNFFTFERH